MAGFVGGMIGDEEFISLEQVPTIQHLEFEEITLPWETGRAFVETVIRADPITVIGTVDVDGPDEILQKQINYYNLQLQSRIDLTYYYNGVEQIWTGYKLLRFKVLRAPQGATGTGGVKDGNIPMRTQFELVYVEDDFMP